MEAGQLWRQHVIAGVANVGPASLGYAMGWTAPIGVKLRDPTGEESPLPEVVTTDQEAWIGSIFVLSSLCGPFIAGFASSKIGRKWSLIASATPLLIGWVLLAAATSVTFMYAGRSFLGVGSAMLFTLTPMYCAEIATTEARGALGSYLMLYVAVGFVIIYGVGPYVSYSATTYIGLAIVVVFAIGMLIMPETPFYYLIKDNKEAAAKSLMTLRGRSRQGIQEELDKISVEVAASKEKNAKIADVFKGSNFKAFYISCFLLFFQQYSGINAVLFYLTNIFEAAGSGLESHIATIIIGVMQFVASCIAPFLVDSLGRRILLLISSCGTAIGLGLLGMYFILDSSGSPVAESIGFLPVLSLVIFIVTYNVGLGPLPWAIMAEMLPIEVKAIASPIAIVLITSLSFLVTRFFAPVSEAVGMYGVFWIFGACCVMSFFFTMFVVPETKKKTFTEIQEMLGGKPSKPEKA